LSSWYKNGHFLKNNYILFTINFLYDTIIEIFLLIFIIFFALQNFLKGDSFMKKYKVLFLLVALLLLMTMLTGCISITMKVNGNGSCDLTYTIDTSMTEGIFDKTYIEESIKDGIDDMNDEAGKKIAKLKSFKENKGKKTITATISISDINKAGDGAFFGKVKDYLKDDYNSLGSLMDKKEKRVDTEDVKGNLHMVYLPFGQTSEYGMAEVTVIVPGKIEYVTRGAEITKNNTVVFSGQTPLVVFKKGGGFPVWLLIIIVVILVAFFMSKKKKSPYVSPAQVNVNPTNQTPSGTSQTPPPNTPQA
jgi:energy-coupling factor transporter transmembrane protein EcfT